MSDLVTFLRARLDEDEAVAPSQHFIIGDSEYHACPATRTEPLGDLEHGEDACDCHLAQRRAGVLREVEAKRRIVKEHAPCCGQTYSDGFWDGDLPSPCPTLRLLALPYAEHPDYREEWEPC